jgi:hypothetical protein
MSRYKEKDTVPVSADKHRRIFCSEFSIGFQIPKANTCKVCDELVTATEGVQASNSDIKRLHLGANHKDYILKAADRLNKKTVGAKNDSANFHVVTMDLQQEYPTPILSTGPAIYKRKLWTMNFGIHGCAVGELLY